MLFTHLGQWDLSFSYSENISLEVARLVCFSIIFILHGIQKMLILWGWGSKLIFSIDLYKYQHCLSPYPDTVIGLYMQHILNKCLCRNSSIYTASGLSKLFFQLIPRSYQFKYYNLTIFFNVCSGKFVLGNHIWSQL